jgi:hypothetical protein
MNAVLEPVFYNLLSSSYARLVGLPLIADETVRSGDAAAQARWLYKEASFCVLAHDTHTDPIFIYANLSAQICFEYDWNQITRLPSRLSAEAPNQAERQRLLESVTRTGFINNYRGLRIAKSGRRFWIENATVWQLTDENGILHGQAATFQDWRDEISISANS